MPTYRLSPTPHAIFNEIDQHGLLLGLTRLSEERNATFKQRILDVMVHRAGSDYMGLIYGVTRELGLSISPTLQVNVVLDGNGVPLATNPAIVFQDTKCYLYEDYSNDVLLTTIDRFDTNEAFTLEALKAAIDVTGKYSATILTSNIKQRAMTLFNQRSLGEVVAEDISGKGHRIVLAHTNLLPNTITVESPNLVVRKTSPLNLKTGEYFVDEVSGTVYSAQQPYPGSFIRYEYNQYEVIFDSSPVIFHNLQSNDFKQKMFEVINSNNQTYLGKPTIFGAEIINELLTVYPSLYGE